MTLRRSAASLALVLPLGFLAACGGDDDDAAPTTTVAADESPSETSDADATETDGTDVASEVGAEDVLANTSLEGKASALESALGEDEVDRVEIDGDTIHVYLKGGTFDPTMACMVTGGVLDDGEFAVMHLDGEETACE